jgi:hypothetical protein
LALQANYGILITITFVMIAARFWLRVKIHQARRLLVSDALMGAAWCAALATASFDIVFYKNGALHAETSYTLSNFAGSAEEYEYVAKVRTPPSPKCTARNLG